jgi:hypothetical protein
MASARAGVRVQERDLAAEARLNAEIASEAGRPRDQRAIPATILGVQGLISRADLERLRERALEGKRIVCERAQGRIVLGYAPEA